MVNILPTGFALGRGGAPLILSNWSDAIVGLNELTAPNKQAYADRHGYEFQNVKMEYTAAGMVESLKIAREAMAERRQVMTIGCDVLFMDMMRPLPECLPGIMAMLSRETLTWWPINNDVMVWNGIQALPLIDRIIADLPVWSTYPWFWQNHIWNLMQLEGLTYPVFICEPRELQSVLQPGPGKWQLGDYILHVLDMPTEKKIRLVKDWIRYAGDGTYYPEKIK